FAELLAFFRRHLHPALHQPMPPLATMAAHAESPPTAEQKPAEAQEAHGLPKSDDREMEQAGHQPVPKVKNRRAEPRNGDNQENHDLDYQPGHSLRLVPANFLVCHFSLLIVTSNSS